MLARSLHHKSLCDGCHQPKVRAWHPAMDGWYEVAVYTCNACQARGKVKGEAHQRVAVHDSYPDTENGPLGPLPLVTFTDPDDIEPLSGDHEGSA